MTELMLIGLLGEVGTAGGIAVVAWLFRNDFPQASRACLVFAVVLMGVLALSEAWHQLTDSEVELVVKPSPEEPGGKWGGLYEGGPMLAQSRQS